MKALLSSCWLALGLAAILPPPTSAQTTAPPTPPPSAESTPPQPPEQLPANVPTVPGFRGVIKLDVRDSKEDWTPFTPKKAPEGAPNFLFILYDDTGLAAWSPYGSRIDMPTLARRPDIRISKRKRNEC